MAIDFNLERWETVKKNVRDWWDGKLGRPLIHMTIGGRSPGRAEPKPSRNIDKKIFYNLSVTPEEIIDRLDYNLSCYEYLGDSFPSFRPNFGPCVLSLFMGARPDPKEDGNVWFHPDKDREIQDIHLSFNPDNEWLRRIKDICRVAIDRWGGLVQVGIPELAGNLDALSTFRPGEKLLMDLVDFPEEVKRLTWEAHAAWFQAFDEINSVLKPVNPGYSAWMGFSDTPYYVLQCDFCYMIGTKMFDEFVKPELKASCEKLCRTFYHMDGVGQLPHLDSLLEIKKLGAVQWIPGAGNGGKPLTECWPEVYRKIIKAGKRTEFIGDWRNFDRFIDKIGGGAENFIIGVPADDRREAEAFLKRHGAM